GLLEELLPLQLRDLADDAELFPDALTHFLHCLIDCGFACPGGARLVSRFLQRTNHLARVAAPLDALRVVVPADELEAGQLGAVRVGTVLAQPRQQLQSIRLLVFREQHRQLFVLGEVADLEIVRRQQQQRAFRSGQLLGQLGLPIRSIVQRTLVDEQLFLRQHRAHVFEKTVTPLDVARAVTQEEFFGDVPPLHAFPPRWRHRREQRRAAAALVPAGRDAQRTVVRAFRSRATLPQLCSSRTLPITSGALRRRDIYEAAARRPCA